MNEKQNLRRRARKLNAPLCDNFDRATLAKLDGGFWCYLCGRELSKENATIDHVQPLSRNGFHCIKNAFIACNNCNSRKVNKTLTEYLSERSPKKHRAIKRRVSRLRANRAGIKCGGNHRRKPKRKPEIESGKIIFADAGRKSGSLSSRKTNCKNCGAPLNFEKPRCEYCSTAIIEESQDFEMVSVVHYF